MKQDNRAKDQAQAQLNHVLELMRDLETANERADDNEAIENATTAIDENALSVEVRSDWHIPNSSADAEILTDFKILLCTGGPAVQIIGELGESGQPETAQLQYQDWGTPWTDFDTNPDHYDNLLAYCQQHHFGE